MKRIEKPVQLHPTNYNYLLCLKNELKTRTGMKVSFNDVLSMIAHKITVTEMMEQLNIKTKDKNNILI